MQYGIDVSSNNHPGGAGIDYAAAVADLRARSGGAKPFVIVKATQGTWYVNPWFAADVAGFRAAGAAVAAYLMDEGVDDPAAEEAVFRRVAGPVPQWDDDELPDGNAAYAQHCAVLVAQNPLAGDYLNQSEENAGFPAGAGRWEANYNGQPGVTHMPALIHQYQDNGAVAGIVGPVDLNAWLGNDAQFAAMFSNVAAIPTPEVAVTQLAGPIVDIVVRPQNDGYWLIGEDGGLFAFGNAPVLPNPAVGKLKPGAFVRAAASTSTGAGLFMVGSDGGVFALGDARFCGSLVGEVEPSAVPLEA